MYYLPDKERRNFTFRESDRVMSLIYVCITLTSDLCVLVVVKCNFSKFFL